MDLRSKNDYVCSKSLYNSKYQLLQDVLQEIQGVSYHASKENEEVIDVDVTNRIKSENILPWFDIKALILAKSDLQHNSQKNDRENCNVLFKQDHMRFLKTCVVLDGMINMVS